MVIKRITRRVQQIDVGNVKSNPLSIVFILLALAVIARANQFPEGGELGPGFFPILLSTGIIVFAIVNLVVDDESELDLNDYELAPPVIVLVSLVGYIFVISVAGFVVGSMAFLPAILYYSGVRSKPTIAAVSISFPIVLFYVFDRIFMVPLPEGIIPVSRLLPQLPLGVI